MADNKTTFSLSGVTGSGGFKRSKLSSLDINTEDVNRNRSIKWASKLPVKALSAIALVSLVTSIAISFYINSGISETKNKMGYVGDLRVNTSSFIAVASSNDILADTELDSLISYGNKIDFISSSLKNSDKKIGSGEQAQIKFNTAYKNLEKSKNILSLFSSEKANILSINQSVEKTKRQATTLSAKLADVSNSKLYGASSQAPQQIKDLLFAGEDLNRAINNIYDGVGVPENKAKIASSTNRILVGLESLKASIKQAQDPRLNSALNIINDAQLFAQAINTSVPQIENQALQLMKIKEFRAILTSNAKELSNSTDDLSSSYLIKLEELSFLNYIAIFLFILDFSAVVLLVLHFADKEQKAENVVRFFKKTQNNQAAVDALLAQISPMDSGDFTQKVYMSDIFVSQIAEKIDNTRKTISELVLRMKNMSSTINISALEAEKTSKVLGGVSDRQYEQVDGFMKKINTIAQEMDSVSKDTLMAKDESSESRRASREGELLINQSISKMDRIRANIQESSKKIKKSSESAQSISAVTSLIQNITRQIEVLALNAAIQAASSGEAGREFSIVAGEVQRLSEDSKEATHQILTLVKEVQEDIGEAVSSMEITTQEVVEGAKMTDSAGNALKKIEELSQSVVDRVSIASDRLLERSNEMATVLRDMKTLQNTTNNSKEIVVKTADQVRELKNISKTLNEIASSYKIKEE